MIADVPETKNLIIWSWVTPGACNSNALFICSLNNLLGAFGECCNYCDGIVISNVALIMSKEPTVMAVYHSFIYSSKYKCYVDCTPGNQYAPDYYLYLLSDELKDKELNKFLASIKTKNKNGEEMWEPRFIHENLPYGVNVPKDWILSNPKHNKY